MVLSAESLRVGDSRSAVVAENLSRTQIVMYAGASGDYNPLHSDEVYAKHAGHPGVFAHGMLTMGATAKVLTDWVGDGRLTKYGVRFVAQVWPGDTLVTTATVKAVRQEGDLRLADFTVVTVNQDGQPVVTGSATAVIDGPVGTVAHAPGQAGRVP